LTAAIVKATGKLNDRSGTIVDMARRQASSAELVSTALKSYTKHLLNDVPRLYHSFESSITSLQRALDIAVLHLADVLPGLSSIVPAITTTRQQFEQLRDAVSTASRRLVEPARGSSVVDVQARKASALQRDVADFLTHAIKLMSDVEERIHHSGKQA
jgi:ABC-type transporter Mla subunit MlaD